MASVTVPSRAHLEPRAGSLSIWGPAGDLWAWSSRWGVAESELYGRIVVCKALNLGQQVVLRQMSSRDTPSLYEGCCMSSESIDLEAFTALGGAFRLWNDSRPVCESAVFLLEKALEPAYVGAILADARDALTKL